ncbi:MAG: hypothetical protein VB040_11905, partial [Propionibacterium sp.]|nr:hypothetical protein [Propionibacterium sp.]
NALTIKHAVEFSSFGHHHQNPTGPQRGNSANNTRPKPPSQNPANQAQHHPPTHQKTTKNNPKKRAAPNNPHQGHLHLSTTPEEPKPSRSDPTNYSLNISQNQTRRSNPVEPPSAAQPGTPNQQVRPFLTNHQKPDIKLITHHNRQPPEHQG